MDFVQYTLAARETAVYPDKYKCIYPAVGLVEEIAEFIEKYEDWYMSFDGGWMCQYTTAEVILELSDVLWFFAIFCDDNKLDMEMIFETEAIDTRLQDTLIDCGKFLGVVQKATRKNEFPISAIKVIPHLDNIAGAINCWCDELDVTLSDVMEMNIAKLRDRQSRNVIKGEGDHR